MATVSLCMIVRDEEANLGTCLESVRDLVSDIVVVDTGSKDGTKAVAARLGARVFDHAWTDDFSAARNETLRQAKGTWIFCMDADERLDEVNRGRLKALLTTLDGNGSEKAAYLMQQVSAQDGGSRSSQQIRLFPNLPKIQWRRRVHEQVSEALAQAGIKLAATEIEIEHGGFASAAVRQAKLERNCRLLEIECRAARDAGGKPDGGVLCGLGRALQGLGRWNDAAQVLAECVEVSPEGSSFLREAHWRLATGFRELGRVQDGLAACRAARVVFGDDADLCFLEACLLEEAEDAAGAERALRDLLIQSRPWSFVPGGVTVVEARQCLAAMYRRVGRVAEAEAQWKRLTRDVPTFARAWAGLGEIYMGQKRWEEAIAALQQAGANRSADTRDSIGREAQVQLVQACQVLGRWDDALAACRAGRAEYPDDAALCFLEGQACQELHDLDGAARVWMELLDPARRWQSTDAGLTGFKTRYALGLLYEKQGRAADAEAAWKTAMKEAPTSMPARIALGQLYVRQQRWNDADELARDLERNPEGREHGARLRGQIAMSRGH